MIDIHQLSIDNIIHVSLADMGKVLAKVVAIFRNAIVVEILVGEKFQLLQVPLEDCSPVPLDSKILSMCGFQWDNSMWEHTTHPVILKREGNGEYGLHNSIFFNIDNLHYLQNFMLYATGEPVEFRHPQLQ